MLPSQQFFSHVWMGVPGLKLEPVISSEKSVLQTFVQRHKTVTAGGESGSSSLSIPSLTLYQLSDCAQGSNVSKFTLKRQKLTWLQIRVRIGKLFFISHPKRMLWVLKRTVSMRRFF